jgi:NAD(P)H-dependent FMN reductase
MKALILDGSLVDRPSTASTRRDLIDLLNGMGWQVQQFVLHEHKIAYCLGCFDCWTKTPGRCRIDDVGRTIAEAIIHSDLVIYLTPITFGGYSSELKKAIDRTICLISPFFTKIEGEVHHQARYAHYPALVGVGLLPQPDGAQAALFAKLVERNAINFHAPAHATLVIDGTEAPIVLQEQLQQLIAQICADSAVDMGTGVSTPA